MKYYFISVNENLSSGLLKSQFLSPIRDFFAADSVIISLNKPFTSKLYPIRYVKQLNILLPPRPLAYSFLAFLYLLWALPAAFVLQLYIPKRSTIVARGYISGLLALLIYFLKGTPFIFDPRSLFPLECITARRFARHSIAFHFWLFLETLIVRYSSKTLSVSRGMSLYFFYLYKIKSVLIPCYCSIPNKRIPSLKPTSLREFLDISPTALVLLYYGSLDSGWNNLNLYHSIIKRSSYQFIILSQNYPDLLDSPLSDLPNCHLLSQDSLPYSVNVADVFDAADYGVMFMNRHLDSFTRLGVKFAQYTSHGLPVIVNSYVGEAAYLINTLHLPNCHVTNDLNKVTLSRPSDDEKEMLRRWSSLYFSPKNINKILL